jgi:hypothetical protein
LASMYASESSDPDLHKRVNSFVVDANKDPGRIKIIFEFESPYLRSCLEVVYFLPPENPLNLPMNAEIHVPGHGNIPVT